MLRNSETTKNIEWLSSLRGLFVLLVFESHLQWIIEFSSDFAFVLGRIGVAGFFIMSGFLAVSSIQRRNGKQYLFNRFLRIYPIFWLLLFIVFFMSDSDYSYVGLGKNMLLCSKSMIGSSWMLPIMVFMFIVLVITRRIGLSYKIALYILMIGSIVLSVGRWYTGIKLPVAFFLLSGLGLLAYEWKKLDCNLLAVRKLVILYEITLIASALLSYPNWIWYLVAYNLGGAYSYCFEKPMSNKVGLNSSEALVSLFS